MQWKRKLYGLLVNRKPEIKYCYTQYCCLQRQSENYRLFQAWLYLLRLNKRFYVNGRKTLADLQLPAYQKTAKPCVPYQPSASAKELAQQLIRYEAVSFDIFDTLLLRPFIKPTDLFDLAQMRLQIPDFKQIRITAEQDVRRANQASGCTGEITLEAIYREVEKRTGLSAQQGMQTELELEFTLCSANPYMMEVYRQVQAASVPIYITSDMYLPSPVLRQLLEKNGFSGFQELFVSCEYGGGKYNGVLFRVLQNAADAKRMIHVGDHREHDVACAKRAGLDAIHYSAVNEVGLPFRPVYAMTAQIGSSYCGLVNSWLYHGNNYCSPTYEYGFTCGGILYMGYCCALHQRAEEEYCHLIIDDAVLLQVYQKLYPEIVQGTRAIRAAISWNAEMPQETLFFHPNATRCYMSEQVQEEAVQLFADATVCNDVGKGILDFVRFYQARFSAVPEWLQIERQDAAAPLLALTKFHADYVLELSKTSL